jgi:hypothetical protein
MAGVGAFATLAERPLVTSPSPQQPSAPAAVQALGLGPARRLRPALIHGFGWIRQLDNWLVVQPQLAVMLVGAILAILLIHS